MKYCKRCTMPDTRPGITFDENGSIDYYLDYADELEGLAWRPLPEPYIRGD